MYKLFEEEHPDIVVNFAAESHVDRSIEDPGIFLETNIKGTAVLMDAWMYILDELPRLAIQMEYIDGIKKTIKWYLENKKWWQDIISGEYQKYYEKIYGNR